MQAITIFQPWAWAIAAGFKLVENRTFAPSWKLLKLGDRIAIHAGLQVAGIDGVRRAKWALKKMGKLDEYPPPASHVWRPGWGLGTVQAVATFDGVVRSREELEESQRERWVGPIGWKLRDVCQFQQPNRLVTRGQQGMWTLPGATETRIENILSTPEGTDWRRTAP